jgi:electron transport complex protein RnfE
MSQVDYGSITRAGMWTNNPALVQVLGLCPLLAVSNNTINGLGLGLATLLVLTITNGLISAIRNHTRAEIRIPIYVLVIACVVTSIELAMNAWFHDLYRVLGIFIALITTNCIVIARAEAFASKNPVLPSLYDGFMMGFGFMLVLVTLGAMRELIGSGTLFANAHLMFGEAARGFTITLFSNYEGFLLAILPPGAFMALGVLIALKNVINARKERKAQATPATAPAQPEPTPA